MCILLTATSRIKNPLAGIPPHRLVAKVDEFANEAGLSEIGGLLRKAAFVGQNPAEFESVEGLDEFEREALRDEVVHKCKLLAILYLYVQA